MLVYCKNDKGIFKIHIKYLDNININAENINLWLLLYENKNAVCMSCSSTVECGGGEYKMKAEKKTMKKKKTLAAAVLAQLKLIHKFIFNTSMKWRILQIGEINRIPHSHNFCGFLSN